MQDYIGNIVREQIKEDEPDPPLTEEQIQKCIALAIDAAGEAVYETVSDFLYDPGPYEDEWR